MDTFADDTRAMKTLTRLLERELAHSGQFDPREYFRVCRTISGRVSAYAYFKLTDERFVRIDLSERDDVIDVTAKLSIKGHHESKLGGYTAWDEDITSITSVQSDTVLDAVRDAIADARDNFVELEATPRSPDDDIFDSPPEPNID